MIEGGTADAQTIEQRLEEGGDTYSFGDYTIDRRLGWGSLGETFLARHRFIQRLFVLKVLPEDLTSIPGFVDRFQEEVRHLAKLDHPHIVKVENVSVLDQRYFLVNDAIVDEQGTAKHLGQFLKEQGGRLEEALAHRLLLQIADALDYAHGLDPAGRPMMHLGLKLSNVLVREGRSQSEVFLADFGMTGLVGHGHAMQRLYLSVTDALARRESSLEDEVRGQQQYEAALQRWHESFLETLAFLAPEQHLQRFDVKITEKVDGYSFGVLAYQLLLGFPPQGIARLPSTLRPDLTGNWDHLLHQCLSADPMERPASLVEAVEAVYKTKSQPISSQSGYLLGKAAVQSSSPGLPQPVIRSSQLERPETDFHPERAFQVDTEVKVYHPQNVPPSEIEPLNTEMVIISGGSFWRGSSDGKRDELPRHKVNIKSFAIDTHPVTNEQFVRFLMAMGGEKDSFHRDLIRLRDSRIKRSGGKFSIESGYHQHPVVGVTWYGASAYAKWVGKRLPSEAEWEIAASGGGADLSYPTGDTIDKSTANYFSADTTQICAYPANALGLHDMGGNVYEWCLDWYDYNYYERSVQEPDNPLGPRQGVYRVLRGGCWKSLKEDLRCSRRHRNNPGSVNSTYGFRCAADVQ